MIVRMIVVFALIFGAVMLLSGMGTAKRRKVLKDRLADNLGGPAPAGGAPQRLDQSLFSLLDEKLRSFASTASLRRALKRANVNMRVSEFMLFVILCASFPPLLTMVFSSRRTLVPIVAAMGAAAPFLWLKQRRGARKKQFDNQLIDAVTLISNSLKSGYSFMQSMDLVVKELEPPISEEFQKVIQETRLGLPLDRAVKGMIDRVDNEDLDMMMTSVMIQREVGGNLSEVLDKIGHTIRERVRIRGQVRALSAQGRLSGIILGLLPASLGLILYMMTPEYIRVLFTDPRGRMLLFGAGFMQLIGLLMIRKIVDIKV